MSKIGPCKWTSKFFNGSASTVSAFVKQREQDETVEHIKCEAYPERDVFSKQRLSVTITNEWTLLANFSPDDPFLIGVQSRVAEILERRVRWRLPWAFDVGILAACSSVTVLSIGLLGAATSDTAIPRIDWVVPFILLLLAVVTCVAGRERKGAVLLVPREKRPGFFARNRDQLIVAAFSSAVSGLVGFLLGRIT